MGNYNFSFSVHLKHPGKTGRDFLKGVREVSEDYEYHPYFLKLVGLGLVTEAAPAPASVDSLKDKQKTLLDKILARKAKAEEKVEAPKAEEKVEAPVEEKTAPKSKKKG